MGKKKNNQKKKDPEIAINTSQSPGKPLGGMVRNYTKEETDFFSKQKVYIAMPCYGGWMGYHAALGLVTIAQCFKAVGLRWEIQLLANESLVQRARNQLSMHFLMAKGCTHMMFIDADIGFSAEPILEMLLKDKDIIGCVYPKKEINWRYIFQEAPKIKKHEDLRNYSASYASNFVLDKRGNPIEEGGLLRIHDLATGFMLIRRQVFLDMQKKWPDKYYTPDYDTSHYRDTKAKHYAFFECEIDKETNRYFSEDYYFCARWRDLGGEIWCYPNYDLAHMGTYMFKGSLIK